MKKNVVVILIMIALGFASAGSLCAHEQHQACSLKSGDVIDFQKKTSLDEIFNRFKKGKSWNEITMQYVIDLLTQEIIIVDQIMHPRYGCVLQESVAERNKLLARSYPTVRRLYDDIMNVATQDARLEICKNFSSHGNFSVINARNKRVYLSKVKQVLQTGCDQLEAMQYEYINAPVEQVICMSQVNVHVLQKLLAAILADQKKMQHVEVLQDKDYLEIKTSIETSVDQQSGQLPNESGSFFEQACKKMRSCLDFCVSGI